MKSEIEQLPEWVQENVCQYWKNSNDETYTFIRGMTLASTDNQELFSELLFLQAILTLLRGRPRLLGRGWIAHRPIVPQDPE